MTLIRWTEYGDVYKRQDQKVDVAVIEVGMGGRLDCTNIIHPNLCVITNISFDHMQYLGNTLTKIAKETAGIIKEGVPVVDVYKRQVLLSINSLTAV